MCWRSKSLRAHCGEVGVAGRRAAQARLLVARALQRVRRREHDPGPEDAAQRGGELRRAGVRDWIAPPPRWRRPSPPATRRSPPRRCRARWRRGSVDRTVPFRRQGEAGRVRTRLRSVMPVCATPRAKLPSTVRRSSCVSRRSTLSEAAPRPRGLEPRGEEDHRRSGEDGLPAHPRSGKRPESHPVLRSTGSSPASARRRRSTTTWAVVWLARPGGGARLRHEVGRRLVAELAGGHTQSP